jgi:hypothetical protein
MNNKSANLGAIENSHLTHVLPETLAKSRKEEERERNRKMRLYFEQKREQQELEKQLQDPFDSYDFDE